MESVIRLFKAVPVSKKSTDITVSPDLIKKTAKLGFIFSPGVVQSYPGAKLDSLINMVAKEVGVSGRAMNNSFHKSWNKIKTADIVDLVLDQIAHYITTYGYERMGMYSEDTIFIPCEDLKIPKIKLDKISLTIIKGYTLEELKEKLVSLLGAGIALKEETIKDVVEVAVLTNFSEDDILAIRNNEVRTMMYDFLDKIPANPVEFLRLMIYKSIGKTLLIKDRTTIKAISEKDNLNVLGILKKYEMQFGLEPLSSIFYRFKPLFLAFRSKKSSLKKVINKLRRLAKTNHKPLPEDILNSVTAKIARGEDVIGEAFDKALAEATTFRKVRLAYALKYRTTGATSIMYRIRNGKSYSTEFKRWEAGDVKDVEKVLTVVLKSIAKDVAGNVKGKKIYLPKNIHYALPTTEKQFTGDFPSGTYVAIPKDMVVGVHWFNTSETPNTTEAYWGHDGRVDLDLSLLNLDQGKIGWDSSWRTGHGNILFSGDMTSAPKPNGAAEYMYVRKQKESAYILMLNYFNHSGSETEVPFSIIVAKNSEGKMTKNHLINPNKVVCSTKATIGAKQKVLGLLITTPEECRFYFAETCMGANITSSVNNYTEWARRYLVEFSTNTIDLRDVLKLAGAELVDEAEGCDINLSYETLEKDSLIKLLTK